MQFRADVNGLRAIAVMAVMLFHFNESWLPGGFAGVDVFFVISGFLMTGIIFRGLEDGNFSLLKFYAARANRIIPALAFLCFFMLVFGVFFLAPTEYEILGGHIASSLGFISNMHYWRESGYFDAASNEKWLLHTWSLSVEWYERRNEYMIHHFDTTKYPENVKLLKPQDVFCDSVSCYAVQNGEALYFDDDHPSIAGAKKLVNLIE